MTNCNKCGMRIVEEHPHACLAQATHQSTKTKNGGAKKKTVESSFLGTVFLAVFAIIKKLTGR